MSLDGYIAREDGSIDWLTMYENSGEDYGFKELYNKISIVLIGGTTFRQVQEDYKGKEVYVFSSRMPANKGDNIHFVSGNIQSILFKMEKEDKGDMWLVGGANLIHQFMRKSLIDEFIITIIPILLGNGIPLFLGKYPEIKLTLSNVVSYKSGLVQLYYY